MSDIKNYNGLAKPQASFNLAIFRKWFSPLNLQDEEIRNQTYLLRIVLIVAITLSFLCGIAVLFLDNTPQASLISISILLMAELFSLWITYRNKIRLAAFLITFGLGVIFLFITYAYGGVQQVTYSSFVIVILSGGLLLGKRYIWITMSLGVFGGLVILIFQLNHWTPVYELPGPAITWISNGFTFLWAGLILYIAMQNVDLALKQAKEEIEARKIAYDTTLAGWSRALELRDHETQGHSERVVAASINLAKAVGIRGTDLDNLRRGTLLHDIGKMGIPDAILSKPGPLNDEEWKTMRQHPVLAFYLLNPIEYLRPALDIPYCHHEKWDGSGYPRGLKGLEIPLAARVFAVVDVWDALLSDRPYRKGWPVAKVYDYIQEQSGKQFDPHVVEVFLAQMQEKQFTEVEKQLEVLG